MNKEQFVNQLAEQLNCDLEYARKVADLFETNFIIGKKNKEKTINLLKGELNVSEEEADNIYNIASSIVTSNLKEKLKHPFKDLDNK